MNKSNETYLSINKNKNNYISQFNNYKSYINNNYSYNTISTSFFSNSKNKYIYNLKNNFYNNKTSNFSRNIRNYIYNHKNVISLHKNINSHKNKNWKTFIYQRFSKDFSSIHKNTLKSKLLNSKIHDIIEKKTIKNYLKEEKKSNTFITTVEGNNLDDEKDNYKSNKKNKLNKKKKKVIFLERSPNINNNTNKTENIETPTKEEKYVSFNQINWKKNKFLNMHNLTDISLPCINFSNSLNSLNSDINNKKRLAQTTLAKLRIQAIKNELEERYKNFFEKREFPIGLVNATFSSFLKDQKFFYVFGDLTKKYMQSLYNEINKNIIILDKLSKQKDDLVKENDEILKKISSLNEEIKIFESFNNLYLSLKNKTKQMNYLSPRKSLIKSRLTLEKKEVRKNTLFKGMFKRRESLKLKPRNSVKLRVNINIKSPRKSREIFKNTQEIKEIFEEKDKNIYRAYLKYIDIVYDECRLSLEYTKEKEKENKNKEIKEINKNIEQLKNELIILKIENKELLNYKNILITKYMNNENIDENDNIEKDVNNLNTYKIMLKAKYILLNLDINIERYLRIKNIYLIIKEKDSSKNVIYKGQIYSKALFYIKILEFLYLKMEIFENNCLNDKNLREKYIKIKAKREKEMKYLKCEQNLMEEKMIEMKRNYNVINKSNKLIILRNRKFDPFYKKYIKDEVIKKRMKEKEDFDKMNLNNENEMYNNYLYY